MLVLVNEKTAVEEEVSELEKGKKTNKKNWWETIPPLILIGGAIIIFLAFNSMEQDKGNKSYLVLIGIVILVIYLLSNQTNQVEDYVTPREAEILVEREVRRKMMWEQFPLMTKYKIGPEINPMHRDGMGMYYDVAVEIKEPWGLPRYYIGKVMMSGPEKRFTTLIKSLLPMTGREKTQETTIFPKWMRQAEDNTVFNNMVDDMLRGNKKR